MPFIRRIRAKIRVAEARKKMIKTVSETAVIGAGRSTAIDMAMSTCHQTLSIL